ncbi:MAG: hypothetical protein ACRBFS_06130 [Aureispira sp.]
MALADVFVDDRWHPTRMHAYTTAGELLERTDITYDEQYKFDRIHEDYNAEGELLAESGNIKIIEIKYLLDKQNSWVQSIESVNGKPSRFLERSLTYY